MADETVNQHSRQTAYEALRGLSREQLDATARLLLWIQMANPTPAAMDARMRRTFGRDTDWAWRFSLAMEATRKPPDVLTKEGVQPVEAPMRRAQAGRLRLV